MRITRVLSLATLTLLLCGSACTQLGELQVESRSIELADAESVVAEIRMGAGELRVSGGAAPLLEADFAYNVADWKPEVEYRVMGDRGRLTVRQPSVTGGTLGGTRYEWDLRLNDDVLMELSVELGAGRADLILGSLSLTDLEIKTGAGDTILDLTGDWKTDLRARIRGGVGRATVRLPRDVGVWVDAKAGIGGINATGLKRDGSAYVNDAYGESDVTLRIDIKGGVGQINLELGAAVL
ncbi:MAG: toast rack family protein [Terriglobia bacterium]